LLPDRPTIKVPANVKVDLIMTGTDDHGVKDATLHVNVENESLYSKNVLEGRPLRLSFGRPRPSTWRSSTPRPDRPFATG